MKIYNIIISLVITLVLAVIVSGQFDIYNAVAGNKLGALQTTGENSFSNVTTSSSVDALATSTTILAANTNRQYVRITNLSANDVFLGLGTTSIASKGISIAASSTYEINPLNLFKGAIYGVASATSTLLVVEK
jgi:hypothetical protein